MSGGNWKELMYASERGDLDLMRFHLNMGVDPNYQHPEFLTTPLIEAARLGQVEAVKLLLARGADPSIKAVMGGETAMSVAKAYRKKEVVAVLKERL